MSLLTLIEVSRRRWKSLRGPWNLIPAIVRVWFNKYKYRISVDFSSIKWRRMVVIYFLCSKLNTQKDAIIFFLNLQPSDCPSSFWIPVHDSLWEDEEGNKLCSWVGAAKNFEQWRLTNQLNHFMASCVQLRRWKEWNALIQVAVNINLIVRKASTHTPVNSINLD